jgi:hypothetical protein
MKQKLFLIAFFICYSFCAMAHDAEPKSYCFGQTGLPDPEKDLTNNVDGCYYNYPDIDLNGPNNDKETALKLYFGNNLHRLKITKRRWDPNNYLNSSQSIPV